MRPSIAVRVAAERQKLFAVEAQRLPVTVEMLFDQMEGEDVVPGGNWSVRRKYGRRADEISGFVETHPALDQGANAFEHEKRSVAFIGVEDRRAYSQTFEHAHAADSQNHLLTNARFLVAAVKPGREFAVPGIVFFNIGSHQVNRNRTYPNAPHLDINHSPVQVQSQQPAVAMARDHRLHRGGAVIEPLVAGLLTPLGRDALMKVTLRVNEAHADQRQS